MSFDIHREETAETAFRNSMQARAMTNTHGMVKRGWISLLHPLRVTELRRITCICLRFARIREYSRVHRGQYRAQLYTMCRMSNDTVVAITSRGQFRRRQSPTCCPIYFIS